MGSHILLVHGGCWTKKQSHPATRLFFATMYFMLISPPCAPRARAIAASVAVNYP